MTSVKFNLLITRYILDFFRLTPCFGDFFVSPSFSHYFSSGREWESDFDGSQMKALNLVLLPGNFAAWTIE